MTNKYLNYIAKDLGIVSGIHDNVSVIGIFLYKPYDSSSPEESNNLLYLARCIERGSPNITIPNKPLRRVFVNERVVYRNLKVFDDKKIKDTIFGQKYWCRGDIKIEFNEIEGLEKHIQALLDKNMGFIRSR
ncbi:MAG: hypothetical protein WC867_05975 [Candidatus Pacearchaeota archaeon]|jgi:hypothetical protein